MAKITNPDQFINMWEDVIPTLSVEELNKYLIETSSHHPNENMRWLYDRLLAEKTK